MAAREDEGPYRQQDRLEPQDHRVHQADRVDRVQGDALKGADVGRLQLCVVAGVDVDRAAAPRGEGVEAACEERLETGDNRTGAPSICFETGVPAPANSAANADAAGTSAGSAVKSWTVMRSGPVSFSPW